MVFVASQIFPMRCNVTSIETELSAFKTEYVATIDKAQKFYFKNATEFKGSWLEMVKDIFDTAINNLKAVHTLESNLEKMEKTVNIQNIEKKVCARVQDSNGKIHLKIQQLNGLSTFITSQFKSYYGDIKRVHKLLHDVYIGDKSKRILLALSEEKPYKPQLEDFLKKTLGILLSKVKKTAELLQQMPNNFDISAYNDVINSIKEANMKEYDYFATEFLDKCTQIENEYAGVNAEFERFEPTLNTIQKAHKELFEVGEELKEVLYSMLDNELSVDLTDDDIRSIKNFKQGTCGDPNIRRTFNVLDYIFRVSGDIKHKLDQITGHLNGQPEMGTTKYFPGLSPFTRCTIEIKSMNEHSFPPVKIFNHLEDKRNEIATAVFGAQISVSDFIPGSAFLSEYVNHLSIVLDETRKLHCTKDTAETLEKLLVRFTKMKTLFRRLAENHVGSQLGNHLTQFHNHIEDAIQSLKHPIDQRTEEIKDHFSNGYIKITRLIWQPKKIIDDTIEDWFQVLHGLSLVFEVDLTKDLLNKKKMKKSVSFPPTRFKIEHFKKIVGENIKPNMLNDSMRDSVLRINDFVKENYEIYKAVAAVLITTINQVSLVKLSGNDRFPDPLDYYIIQCRREDVRRSFNTIMDQIDELLFNLYYMCSEINPMIEQIAEHLCPKQSSINEAFERANFLGFDAAYRRILGDAANVRKKKNDQFLIQAAKDKFAVKFARIGVSYVDLFEFIENISVFLKDALKQTSIDETVYSESDGEHSVHDIPIRNKDSTA